MDTPKGAYVRLDPDRLLLVGSVDGGPVFESSDAAALAELLFMAGVRHGYVRTPDWREGDIAPRTGDKIALNHRLNQLGRGIEQSPTSTNQS